MSTSDVSEALRAAARLRGQIDALEPVAPRRRSSAGRAFSVVTAGLTCLVLLVLVVDGSFAYYAFRADRPGSAPSSSAAVPSYADVQIFSASGAFSGRASITNPFARDIEVFVTIDLYDGEQQVGEINGHVTLKPNSTSVVELTGFNDFVPFTDRRVHLSGWPI